MNVIFDILINYYLYCIQYELNSFLCFTMMDIFVFLLCFHIITSKMQKAVDTFRMVLNSAIVLGLNGSVLQRLPVSEQSWTMDCQWQSQGCPSQINLRRDYCGWRAKTWWLIMMKTISFTGITPVLACGQGTTPMSQNGSSTIGIS